MIDGYKVISSLGEGGQGLVYHVQDDHKNDYAIKVFKINDTSFKAEVLNQSNLVHKNIIR
jgi:serine/threonine protein kinase